ncbi:MAG TPA: S9 family peptidase, partial [Allosphingosinicella sp.]
MNKLVLAMLSALALAPAAASARPMTATDLASMRRIAAPSVSPDGRWLVYQLRETDLAANRGRTDLWLLDMATPGAQPFRLMTSPEFNESSPVFSVLGVYFISNRSGVDQLWLKRGRETPEQLTDVPGGISGFSLSPAGDRIAIWADRNMACADLACANVPAAEQGRGSARVYDEGFVRHWDAWAEPNVRSRIFTFPLVNGRPTGGGVPVAPRLVGDSPSKPFGGAEEIAWSADGRTLYFTLREGGASEPTSTNLDIYAVASAGGSDPVNLTAGNRATDTLPAASPDGRWLAYAAMRRPGFEADRQVLYLRDLRTGQVRALTEAWDRSVGSIAWAPDGRSLYVTAQDVLDHPLYRIDAR